MMYLIQNKDGEYATNREMNEFSKDFDDAFVWPSHNAFIKSLQNLFSVITNPKFYNSFGPATEDIMPATVRGWSVEKIWLEEYETETLVDHLNQRI